MLRKQFILLIAVFGIIFCGITASADEPCTREFFAEKLIQLSEKLNIENKTIKIPEQYRNGSKVLVKAASKGIIPPELISDKDASVSKQDAVKHIYDILIAADSQYEITENQADEILNTCYDNALIKPENKIAYASMIRHGVIGIRGRSNPDEVFTEASAEAFMIQINSLFEKKLPISVGDKTISIGSSVNEVFSKFGEPSRIEKSEYDFDWYIYNSDYTKFLMVGVRDDVVCAYFSNAAALEFDRIKSGSTRRISIDDPALTYIRDPKGKLDGIYYNASEKFYYEDTKSHSGILIDLINAYRAKHGLITFVKDIDTIPVYNYEQSDRRSITLSAPGNCFDAYKELLFEDGRDGILSHGFGAASIVEPRLILDNEWEITATDSKNTVISSRNVYFPENEFTTEIFTKAKTPEIVYPTTGTKTLGGGLIIKLKERASNKYLVRLYNCETEQLDINAYISSKSDKIAIPAYMITDGNVYRVSVTAIGTDKEYNGNTVEYTHGDAQTPVSVVSPEYDLSTYDDEIEISLYSSAYHNFRVDIYNADNKPVYSQELKNTSECILPSMPAGIYHVCASAISKIDGKEKGNAFSTVQIKSFVPIIREYILEPGEEFDYYYGDGEKWLYFYDTETIAVTDDKTVTMVVPDMSGDPDPMELVPVEDVPFDEGLITGAGSSTEPPSDETEKPESSESSQAPEQSPEPEPTSSPQPSESDEPSSTQSIVPIHKPSSKTEDDEETPAETEKVDSSDTNTDNKTSSETKDKEEPKKPSESNSTKVPNRLVAKNQGSDNPANTEPSDSETTSDDADEQDSETTSDNADEQDSEPSETTDSEPSRVETSEDSQEDEQDNDNESSSSTTTQTKKVDVIVYKTKVTQRIVPATKKYKALQVLIPQKTKTTGAFIHRTTQSSNTAIGDAIATMAMSYQGVPYVWGGTSPTGFDCSGLVKYICNSLGIENVPRTSREQFASAGAFVNREDLIPGDLIFFQKNGVIHHVGIYIGNNNMVHAPHTGDVVRVANLSDPYYQREYAGAKRVAGYISGN